MTTVAGSRFVQTAQSKDFSVGFLPLLFRISVIVYGTYMCSEIQILGLLYRRRKKLFEKSRCEKKSCK